MATVVACQAHTAASSTEAGAALPKLKLESAAFKQGEPIPNKYTCSAEDLSPPLSWSGVPAAAKSLALICDDPDAPRGTWVHWVLYNLDPETTSLPEGVAKEASGPASSRQGTSDFKRVGYGGPCPPPGKPHRYFFKLYAVDRILGLDDGATKAEVMKAIEGHVVARGELMGTFAR
ncbi:MAG: YbhB/YbcL family Raf kinase inhibitor-like protein [Deltaproteobacteria bacterium]|nr:YbhB/YbcL family Raf kinase inhibitor-like protein [Deltaproteobacteria bacterium]